MLRALLIAIVCFLLGFGAWYALGYQPDDPGGRAKLIEWAGKVSGSTSSEAKGWSCSLSTSVDQEESWVLELMVQPRDGASAQAETRPNELRVEVNEVVRIAGVNGAGKAVVQIPIDAFHLNERANDVRIQVVQADGRDFGGWAFGRITFSDSRVGIAQPTWIERVLD